MKDVMGIVNDAYVGENLKQLVDYRSVAAIPFGGRYRLIDFPLSNIVNSGIKNVGIFTHLNNRSLLEHLGSGKDWDLGGKRDGLFILPPMQDGRENYKNLGDVDFYHKHKDYIIFSRQKYVVVANSNCIYNLDLTKVKEFFMDNYADVAMVYKQNTDETYGKTFLDIESSSKRVSDIAINPNGLGQNVFCNILFMRKELFLGLIDYCVSRGFTDLIKDGLIPRLTTLRVMGYEYEGFYGEVHDPLSYYYLNKSLLNQEKWNQLFSCGKSILTRVQNEPPARYCEGSLTKNSLVANGCVIEGEVINSILFRGVHVKRGAVVKDSIIMQKGIVNEDSVVENSILDKNTVVSRNTKIISSPKYPLIIERRSEV